MWLVYIPIAVIALAAVGLLAGAPALAVLPIMLLVLLVALGGGLGKRMKERSISQASGGQAIPDSRTSAYEPRVDPGRTPTGSTTGT